MTRIYQPQPTHLLETQLLPPCREATELDEQNSWCWKNLKWWASMFQAPSPKVGFLRICIYILYFLFEYNLTVSALKSGYSWRVYNRVTFWYAKSTERPEIGGKQPHLSKLRIQWNSIQAWSSGCHASFSTLLVQVLSNPVLAIDLTYDSATSLKHLKFLRFTYHPSSSHKKLWNLSWNSLPRQVKSTRPTEWNTSLTMANCARIYHVG